MEGGFGAELLSLIKMVIYMQSTEGIFSALTLSATLSLRENFLLMDLLTGW